MELYEQMRREYEFGASLEKPGELFFIPPFFFFFRMHRPVVTL